MKKGYKAPKKMKVPTSIKKIQSRGDTFAKKAIKSGQAFNRGAKGR